MNPPFGALLAALETLHYDPQCLRKIDDAVALALDAKQRGSRFFFIGNGGSAAIASHMAIDWLKNGNVAAQCFNDGAALTCLGNDVGFENVFARQIAACGNAGDVLFAISSSGNSPDIIKGVQVAQVSDMIVIALSGFEKNNALSQMGNINFHVESKSYGVVEIAHLAICHHILDRVIAS